MYLHTVIVNRTLLYNNGQYIKELPSLLISIAKEAHIRIL